MKTSTLLLTVLGAAAAGVVAGILLAPDKGSETRRKIAETADDLKAKASDLIKTGKDYVTDLTNAAKQHAQQFEQQTESGYSSVGSDIG